MYDKTKKIKELMAMRNYAKKLNQLSKIAQGEQTEEQIESIGKFISDFSEEIQNREKIVDLCREYCSLEMNEVCFAQEIFDEQCANEKKKEQIKEEIRELDKILTELDKFTTTTKITMEKRLQLVQVIKGKQFTEFNDEFNAVVRQVKMVCSTEISLEEANQFFRFVASNLKTLSKFLK